MFEELTCEPDSVGTTKNPRIFVVRDGIDFDESAFIRSLDEFLDRTRAYTITPTLAVDFLKWLGFAIQ